MDRLPSLSSTSTVTPAASRRTEVNLDRLAQVDALLTQTAPDQFRSFRLVARQDDVPLQHGHGGPEAPEGLGQFKSDRAAADDDEVFGPFGQIEDGFIGVGAGFGQTRNGRQCGAGTGGNDEAPGRDPLGAGDDLVRCRKARLCLYHLNAKRTRSVRRCRAGRSPR